MEISIIVPVYNTEQYLSECLDSVLAQQFEDWECLLINDGSTDNSGTICDLYAKKDSRFRVFHTANYGVSFARNRGVENASGKYIAFVDSDDTIDNNYLFTLHQATECTDAELIVCGMKLISPSEMKINIANRGFVFIKNEDSNRFIELCRKFLLYGPVVKLYRSDIINKNKIRFPLGVQYGEDLIFNLEYLEHVFRIQVLDLPGYNYRIFIQGSLSSSSHSRDFNNNYEQWKMLRTFCERKKIDGLNTRIYLSDRLWGIVYDLVMSNKLPVKEIKEAFSIEFTNYLQKYNKYTIAFPSWLKLIVVKRLYRLMWLVQRRDKLSK